jgi:recombinational DNA repair protein (RecF pathway)
MSTTDTVRRLIPRSEYRHKVKKNCVVCGKSLPQTITHYEIAGNFCIHCNAKCGRNALSSRYTEKKLDYVLRNLLKEYDPEAKEEIKNLMV